MIVSTLKVIGVIALILLALGAMAATGVLIAYISHLDHSMSHGYLRDFIVGLQISACIGVAIGLCVLMATA